jgi:hypothetical protein
MSDHDSTGDAPPEHMALTATRADVEAGLGRFFPASQGFLVPEVFQGAPVTNGRQTAVVWEYRGRHDAEFQGIPATGRQVVIRGTTIVDHEGPDPQFHRYVDWLDLMAQLGVTATMRPALDHLPRAGTG